MQWHFCILGWLLKYDLTPKWELGVLSTVGTYIQHTNDIGGTSWHSPYLLLCVFGVGLWSPYLKIPVAIAVLYLNMCVAFVVVETPSRQFFCVKFHTSCFLLSRARSHSNEKRKLLLLPRKWNVEKYFLFALFKWSISSKCHPFDRTWFRNIENSSVIDTLIACGHHSTATMIQKPGSDITIRLILCPFLLFVQWRW